MIGLFDSGIGGLTTLEEIKKILPSEDFLYFGDSKNNPYGEKSQKELERIVKENTEFLIRRGAKMIVIACNTATTKCIDFLRKEFPEMIFVGTEPAIKLACKSGYKNILVMATPGTIVAERTHNLVAENQEPEQNITLIPCAGLAEAIEAKSKKQINKKLNELLNDYREEKVDAVVLGCTHYIYVKERIAKFFPNAKLIDGNKNVAMQVKKLLDENNLAEKCERIGKTEIIFSGDNK